MVTEQAEEHSAFGVAVDRLHRKFTLPKRSTSEQPRALTASEEPLSSRGVSRERRETTTRRCERTSAAKNGVGRPRKRNSGDYPLSARYRQAIFGCNRGCFRKTDSGGSPRLEGARRGTLERRGTGGARGVASRVRRGTGRARGVQTKCSSCANDAIGALALALVADPRRRRLSALSREA